ncbi:hypothetical protein QQY24_16930 [Streptomyces sp. TG1A-8]|uniref:hypothetical protein n=1 Tax=Streptomyces sp. TG1A-8 TaxID=3051385 RepID=UPI00265B8EA6|nr:hypothetical protein [Streptomyces sp. TG1A-8]MDO0927018.1 hypothetical protein [Streptomyces sp. TG1A-8]
MAEARDRRRAAYKDLSAAVHALSEVFWKMEDIDRTADRAERIEAMGRMKVDCRARLNEVTRASRDVLLEGPTAVARAARALSGSAVATHHLLVRLHDADDEPRSEYDRAYRRFQNHHLSFVELAREALEVR